MGAFRALHAEQGRFELIRKLSRDQRGKAPDKLKRVTPWRKQTNFPKAKKWHISLKHLRVLEEAQKEKQKVRIKSQISKGVVKTVGSGHRSKVEVESHIAYWQVLHLYDKKSQVKLFKLRCEASQERSNVDCWIWALINDED